MAFANNIGAAQRGLATGSANYLTWLQNTAAANELLANAQYIEEQQKAPVAGMQIPKLPSAPMQAPGLNIPQLPNTPVGVMPQGSWAPWDNLPAAPRGPAAPVQTNIGKLPWKVGGAAPAGDGWAIPWQPPVPHNEALYPTAGVSRLQGATNSVVEAFNNVPTNLMRGVNNVVTRPIVNTLQFLGSPPSAPTPEVSQNIEYAGQTPSAGVSVPPSGVSGAPPTAGLSGPASPSRSADGTSAGVAETPSSSATPASLMPTREVRDEALTLSDEDHNYYQEMIMQQRDQIEQDVNRQTQFLEAQKQQLAMVQQQKLNRLMNDAAIAQRTGNIGLMKRLQDQADDILIEATAGLQQFDTQQQQLRESATQLFRQNEQDLWRQQALQAEAEFINRGDPSRMIHIFDAYGFPIRLQDAGGGKYHVIDITGEGQGRRRGSGAYTPEQIGDMFHSMISDEFRQQQAASQASNAAELFKHSLDLDKIDAQAAADIQKAIATEMAKPEDYQQQPMDDGSVVYFPKSANGNMIVYNPNPPEIPNSGGLLEPKVKVMPVPH